MSNLTALISGGGAAGAAAEGGSTMVTSTGIAAQDLVVGDSVKLTGTGQFIKDPEQGDRYYINKKYLTDIDGHAQTPYLWPSLTYQRRDDNQDLPFAITLSTGHTMTFGHGYIATNSQGTLKFFTMKPYELDPSRFHVVDTQNVSNAYVPEQLKFFEIGDDADNVYVMYQQHKRSSNWPYYKQGHEIFFAVEKSTGNIVRHMTNQASGYPGTSIHPYTQNVTALDQSITGDMAGDIACYHMRTGDYVYNAAAAKNIANYGYAFRKLDPTTTVIPSNATAQFAAPGQIAHYNYRTGVIAVDQTDRVFIAWSPDPLGGIGLQAQVVKFDATGAMTIVAPWYSLYASGTSTSLTATAAHGATLIKGADGTVALVNASSETQLEVQKFVWNGTALVESGSVYTIDVNAQTGARGDVLPNNMQLSGRVSFGAKGQYKNNSFYFGYQGNLVEIDLIADTVTSYYVGLFGAGTSFPTSNVVMGNKYVTFQDTHYSSTNPYVMAATYAQLKNDVVTQEDVAVVTTGASAGGTATVQLNPGIVAQAPLPASKYITKDSMAYPLATRLVEDMPSPPLFHVPREISSAPAYTGTGSNYNTFNAGAGFGNQWDINTIRNASSHNTMLANINGMGHIQLYVGSTNQTTTSISAGFQIVIDGVVVWDNLNARETYSNMNDSGAYITAYSGNFNKSIQVYMNCSTTGWFFSFAKKVTMY